MIIGAGLMLFNDRRNYIWPLLLGAWGIMLLLNNLHITNINLGDIIFPAIIIAIGIGMLTKSRRSNDDSTKSEEEITAILSGATSRNTSKNYTGGKVSAILGGVEMDLSHANIKSEASLDVLVLMGGLELRVAEDVVVKNRSSVILGGFEDKTKPTNSKNQPTLYIDGSIVMGGIEIKR